MTMKRTLIAVPLAAGIALISGVFLYANTRPVIPADKMQPDLDPATATPEQWRAQAERIVAAASAVMPLVSEELDRDGIPHKDALRHYLGVHYGELGDPESVARLSEERATVGRQSGWLSSARAPASIGDIDTVSRLVELAPTDEIRDRLRLKLIRAYANADDPESAVELYQHPDLAELIQSRPVLDGMSEIIASIVRAGKQSQARELLLQAEQMLTPSKVKLIESLRYQLMRCYIIAGDLDSARRLLTEIDADDYDLGEFAEQQARQIDFKGARATREVMEEVLIRVYSCADAARHLALAGEEDAARELFAEAIAIAEAMEPEWDYRDTMTNETALIHTARRQHEAGFVADAARTTGRAFELIEQQHSDEFYKTQALAELLELLLEIEQSELAKEVYERTAAITTGTTQSDGDVFDLLINLGRAASKLGKPDASAEHFEAALDLAIFLQSAPDPQTQHEAVHVLQTAIAQSESGEQDAAAETLTLATQILRRAKDSDRDEIRDDIAKALVLTGRTTAALNLAEQIEDPYDRAWLLCELAAINVDKARSEKYWGIHGD